MIHPLIKPVPTRASKEGGNKMNNVDEQVIGDYGWDRDSHGVGVRKAMLI
jgi:hypothetical protein